MSGIIPFAGATAITTGVGAGVGALVPLCTAASGAVAGVAFPILFVGSLLINNAITGKEPSTCFVLTSLCASLIASPALTFGIFALAGVSLSIGGLAIIGAALVATTIAIFIFLACLPKEKQNSSSVSQSQPQPLTT